LERPFEIRHIRGKDPRGKKWGPVSHRTRLLLLPGQQPASPQFPPEEPDASSCRLISPTLTLSFNKALATRSGNLLDVPVEKLFD